MYGHGAPLVAQMVKNLPAVQETQIRHLGWEDPLEKGMAIWIQRMSGKTHTKLFKIVYADECIQGPAG